MPKKNLALNNMFPVTHADTPAATQEALSKVFPEVEEEALKSVVQDIWRVYRNIPVDKIAPNPFQPRRKFDELKLQELAESLNEEGMLEPILVRVSSSRDGTYEIAAGERRWRAALLAGWESCPAEVMESCPDARMKRIALLENILREPLSPLELAQMYESLMQELGDDGRPVYTVRSLAVMLKKDKGHVDDHRALLRVPQDVRQLIEDDPDIPVRVIRELGSVEDAADRAYLIEEVRARSLKTADVLAILQQSRKRRRRQHTSQQQEQQTEVDTTTQSKPGRTREKPSAALVLAVLERKLQKDQAQLRKVLDSLASELPSMSDEEKALVHAYAGQWRDMVQRLVDLA
jgi:ParB family transcriptional regulator, chromosome partitioning protein